MSTDPGGFGNKKFPYSKFPFGPVAITVDKYDRVLVSSLNDRVQFFTTDGKSLAPTAWRSTAKASFTSPTPGINASRNLPCHRRRSPLPLSGSRSHGALRTRSRKRNKRRSVSFC